MSLERTLLNELHIRDLLQMHYGIDCTSVVRLSLGTANCYCVTDGENSYFLKEFQSGFPVDDISREAALVDYLAAHDIPVARVFSPREGGWSVRFKGHLITLSEYVGGITYGYDDMPAHRLESLAQMLGRLHAVLRDYPLPMDMGSDWLDAYSAENSARKYDELIAIAKARDNDSNTKRIVADLEYKKDLAWRCQEYKKYYDGVTYNPTHGDYQGCQLIWREEGIRAVIDFSSARTLPVTWEIMRSFVQSSDICRREAVIDLAAFCNYVKAYMQHFHLTRTDLYAMPYVYLFQLARSRYGYPQYFEGSSEDGDGLLRFATWRTAMCREVERRSEEIGKALLAL